MPKEHHRSVALYWMHVHALHHHLHPKGLVQGAMVVPAWVTADGSRCHDDRNDGDGEVPVDSQRGGGAS